MRNNAESFRRIPFFNPLYSDELLYSGCARYSDRVVFKAKDAAMQDLFGSSTAKATIDLPSRIDHFITILPPGHPYDANQIINKNTLFPFYAPFLTSKERFDRLHKGMRGNSGSGIHQRAGILAKGILSPGWLRFCPCCIEEDRREHGETFWHRVHQLPGAEICPLHEVFLENSDVRAKNLQNAKEFISAERALLKLPSPRFIDSSNPVYTSLLRIARNMFWLLNQENLDPAPDALRNRYLYLLLQRELASHTGKAHRLKLQKAFMEHHSQELLTMLQCEINPQANNWLRRLLQPRPLICSSHPLYHLLLIDFLGYSVEDFFKLPEEVLPFGRGPWPCLNPICEYYRVSNISEVEIKWNYASKKLPIGVFKCTCGFTYSRKGPDLSAEKQYQIDMIISRGHVWESKLRELWADLNINLTEIVERLGTYNRYIISYAAQLDLPFPRKSKHGMLIVRPINPSAKKSLSHEEKLETYRQEWLSAIATYPNESRTFLKQKFQRLHRWLCKYDMAWLEANLPVKSRRRTSFRNGERIDWNARDAELSAKIKGIVERIKSKPGRLKKITLTAIERELDSRGSLHNMLEKLPLTSMAIDSEVESTEDFTIRRIWWVFNCCCYENTRLTRSQIIIKSKISSETLKSIKVQRVLDEVVELFKLQGGNKNFNR